jgi:hypothetical protein
MLFDGITGYNRTEAVVFNDPVNPVILSRKGFV